MRSGKIIIIISVSLLMGGCSLMNLPNKSNQEDQGKQGNYKEENYVAVQDYTGEGFRLHGSNPKYGEIAEANREQVEEAVEQYFLNNYKTDVKVHNIVSAKDGVSVFVESIGEPHFYSMAIVPIDLQHETVLTDSVWSLEGDIEGSITSGLYVMAFEEEFNRLDTMLEEIGERYSLVAEPTEMISNVRGNGYNTSYYFVTSGFTSLYDMYMENPEVKGEELRGFLQEHNYKLSESNGIPIRYYLDEPGLVPTNELVEKIYDEITEAEGIPGGRYSIILNDNDIDSRRANGEMENTITKDFHVEGEL